MNAQEIVSLFRNEVADIEQPYLWTDSEVMTYLDDAYTMLVRFLGGVPDASSAATALTFQAGDREVPLNKAITRIVRAFRESDGKEISVIEHTDVPLVRDGSGRLSLLRVGSESGPVEFLILGSDRNKAALHPIPDTNDALRLQVRRNPLARILTGTDELVDLDEEHHIHLTAWMKSCAYRKQDSDTFDMDKAMLNEQLFLSYCEQSTYEQERFRRKSRVSLRTDRDLRNPMLMTAAANRYRGAPGGQGQGEQ